MRDYPSPSPEPSVILPHKEEARVQGIRDNIRELAAGLPRTESAPIIAQLDAAEAEIRRKRKAEIEASSFDWNRVPNEIRNMIYEYLMVQEKSIEPFVAHAGDPERRSLRKFDLGGNLLIASKEIYQQALPMLLGANTFEVNLHLMAFLGTTKKSRTARAKLIKKVVISAHPTAAEWRAIHKLENLEECTIVSFPKHERFVFWDEWQQPIGRPPREEMERRAAEEFEETDRLIRRRVWARSDVRFHYLHEFSIRVSRFYFRQRKIC